MRVDRSGQKVYSEGVAKQIRLHSGDMVTVDDDVFDELNQLHWTKGGGGYAMRWIDGKLVYMHRMISGTPDGMQTDHINGNKLDNRKENLRICTFIQNMQARKTSVVSGAGFMGVYVEPGRRFRARIKLERKRIHLGTFDTAEEAARAYDAAARELHGEFAKQNFPCETERMSA
jgi:hypothetical protein